MSTPGSGATTAALRGSVRKVNIAAWSVAAFVVILSIVMLVTTGQKVFIIFLVLGLLTPLNVLAYDAFVLKPKLEAARRAEAEAVPDGASTEPGTEAATKEEGRTV